MQLQEKTDDSSCAYFYMVKIRERRIMEFKQLEAFVAVVDYNSFSEAARRLYLTQPTISAHIHTLETELNSRLILRTTKKLSVTDRGYQLYDYAVRMLHMRDHLIEDFTGSQKKVIELGVSTIPSAYLLPELLGSFGKELSDVYFHAWQGDSTGAIQRVLDGSVDLSLVGQKTDDDSCCFLPFCQDVLVLATPVNEHFLRLEPEKVNFQDFLKEPFIMRENGSGTKKEMDLFLEKIGVSSSDLNVVARMNDLESIKKSIVNGIGISILSSCSVKDLAQTRQILLFPLEGPAQARTFYIVYNKNRILKPHVKQFIRFVQNYYIQTESS